MPLQYEGNYFMETEGRRFPKRLKRRVRRKFRKVPRKIVRKAPSRERVIYKIPVSTKKQFAELKSRIKKRDRRINELKAELKSRIKKRDRMIRDHNTQISKFKSVADKNISTIKELESILDEQDEFLDEQDEIIYELESRLGMAEPLEEPKLIGIEEDEDYEEEYPEALDEIDRIQQGNVFEFSYK